MVEERVPAGRPRSEQARLAVLHAVDDLLLEIGYGEMTMKNIAERAGVSRMTVYRWWATKAEILFEASAADAAQELAIAKTGVAATDVRSYLEALARFLTCSAAGAAYRALLGEAQHDKAVATLLAETDVIGDSARRALEDVVPELDEATLALLVGPIVYVALSARGRAPALVAQHAPRFLRTIGIAPSD
ncbi:TetR/AcrR family transcriptional regulator [Humibacter albus]|uniref:TetR/AcrR family transcriptional regulator n=1 Tax=Humibacter albus TaxID=427754 RepID=UPI0003B4ACB1|nr:TetR/AcrR family transcriptional regulator [Humibacter albus]